MRLAPEEPWEEGDDMALIKVNAEGLRSNAAKLNRQASELDALVARTEALLVQMQGTWEGEACVAYMNGMRNKLKTAKDMVGVLESYASYMRTAATTFENTDSQCAGRLRRLL